MGILTDKFYSVKRILKTKATYFMIIGERSNGKTYSALQYGLKEYFRTGKEMAIVRRWKEDIRGNRAKGIFSALVNNGEIEKLSNGQYTDIYYYSGRFYPCNRDDLGKPIFDDTKILGYTFALSEGEHNKSISFPKVGTVIFDEFLTRHLYLKDEFVLFMNTLSTIIRQRDDVKIFMLGNTVNKYSPYFTEMGIENIEQMKQGEINIYRYGDSKLTVAVEYCDSLKKFKKNNHLFAFNSPSLKMITNGTWELSLYPHLPFKYKPKNVIFTYFIRFRDKTFQAEIVELPNAMFTYIHEKTTPIQHPEKDLIYQLDHTGQHNISSNIYKYRNELERKIIYFYDNDLVFYQDNTVGDTIENFLKCCK